jgi:ParB family transcriptional regulator, chromosome partitioning protein
MVGGTASADHLTYPPHLPADPKPPEKAEKTERQKMTTELIQIDPVEVVVGTNVRLDARLDKAFVASIRERGVLVPIVGYRDDAGAFTVLYGQRRTLAAVEAKRTTVPAYVVASKDDADRLIDQMAENDHRAALTAGERAQGFEQLAALGLSAAQIAKRTATPKADVTAGLTVAGSELATKAADRWDFLTLEQAAVLAEFEDDDEAVKALTVAAQRGQFAHTAQRLRDARAEAEELATAAQALTDRGVTVVDRPAWDDKSVLPLDRLTHDGAAVEVEQHAKCPGHAAYVNAEWDWIESTDEDGEDEQVRTVGAVFVCTDWKAQGHTDRYASGSGRPKAADLSEEEREAAKAERRDVIDSNKAWASAETVRREWLKAFLTRKTAPKGSAALIATAMFDNANALSDYRLSSLVGDLLGMEKTYASTKAADTIAKATEGRATVIALGYVLAAYEGQTGKHSWRNVDAGTARYLTFLAANGYDLSEVEQRAAGLSKKKR